MTTLITFLVSAWFAAGVTQTPTPNSPRQSTDTTTRVDSVAVSRVPQVRAQVAAERLDSVPRRQGAPERVRGPVTEWLYDWQSLIGVFLSGFLAFLVVVIWEGWLVPARHSRNVAHALMGETSINLQLLAGQQEARKANPKSIPGDFQMSKVAFDALADRIAELPPELLNSVLLFYNRVTSLNAMPQLYSDLLTQYRAARPNTSVKQSIASDLDATIEVFNRYLDKTLDHANTLQAQLKATAEKGTLRKVRGEVMSRDELDRRVQDLLITQRKNVERLRKAHDDDYA